VKDQNIRKKLNIKNIKISKIIGTVFSYLKNIILLEQTFPSLNPINTRKIKMYLRQRQSRLTEQRLEKLRVKALKAETKNSRFHLEKRSLAPVAKTGSFLEAKLLRAIRSLASMRNKVFLKLSFRKVDFFKSFRSKIILKKAFAFITIIAVIVTAYFQNNQTASGATFTLY
jgi:hypothetical protein